MRGRNALWKVACSMKGFEWDDLRVFLAVQRGQSVRAASALLDVSHSTISRRLSGMESNLGTKLFVRTPGGLVATETGLSIIERAERIESEVLGLEREIAGSATGLSGSIRISMPPLLAHHLIMPHIAEFIRMYPKIEVEVIAAYEIADLTRQHADIAIRFQDEPDDYLVGRRLPDFANCVYATPDYLASNDITGRAPTARWVGWGNSPMQPDWTQVKELRRCKVGHMASDPMTQLAAVQENLGMGFFLCLLGDREPGLVRVPPGKVYKERQGWVLTHPDLITSERVRACVRFLVDAFAQHSDALAGYSR